ncbi:MAG TPA: hypothetical protein VH141_11835 [Pseudonocardia sp.]|jgi:hypothetical protein|nr:hypothetical protein [Pseudonocardia sp.]
MTATTCLDFLTEYLSAVRQQLARRQIVVHSASVHPPMPQQALELSLELSRSAGTTASVGGGASSAGGAPGEPPAGEPPTGTLPTGALPTGAPTGAPPLPLPRERLRAGWHEELGWWAEPIARPGADRRWFAAELVPAADRVADFLAGLTKHEQLGTTAPAPHRYRLLATQDDLLERLDVARRTAAPVKGDVTPVGARR